jgi:hypothetical protein
MDVAELLRQSPWLGDLDLVEHARRSDQLGLSAAPVDPYRADASTHAVPNGQRLGAAFVDICRPVATMRARSSGGRRLARRFGLDPRGWRQGSVSARFACVGGFVI